MKGAINLIREPLLVCMLLVFAAKSAYSEQFLCSPDAVGGVAFHEPFGQWVGTKFKAGPDFIISQPPSDHIANGQVEFIVTELGTDASHIWCETGFSDEGELLCEDAFYTLQFNKETLRFSEIYKIGFVSGENNNDNTPSISIGKCASF